MEDNRRHTPVKEHSENPPKYGNRKTDWVPAESEEVRRRTAQYDSVISRVSQKYKKPILGLAIAGLAVPVVNAGAPATGENTAEANRERMATASESSLLEGEDAEAAVERRIAESAAAERAGIIDAAVEKYNIPADLAEDIHDYAAYEGINPEVGYGLVFTESTFRHRAVSSAGAIGLTQLLPSTAKWIMPEEVQAANQLYEQDTNLKVGFKYLRYLIDKYDGDMENALTAYNRGPGTVDKVLSRGGNPDNGYAGKVLGS